MYAQYFLCEFVASILAWWPGRGPWNILLQVTTRFQEYEVERMMYHKNTRVRTIYKVKWNGYDAMEDGWLREEDLANDLYLLRAYRLRHGN